MLFEILMMLLMLNLMEGLAEFHRSMAIYRVQSRKTSNTKAIGNVAHGKKFFGYTKGSFINDFIQIGGGQGGLVLLLHKWHKAKGIGV